MDNKKIFEKWLESFRWNPKEKKLRSRSAIQNYLSYLNNIEKDLDIVEGSIYRIKKVNRLNVLEDDLRASDKFRFRKIKQQHNYLSALHTYKHLVEILETKKSKLKKAIND